MEQRKILSLGRSSLVVSLPKYWTELNELKKGDSVSVAVQRDRSLAVFPSREGKKEERKITLHIKPDEDGGSIARKVIACYLNGYFGIRLVADDIFTVRQQRTIRDVTAKLYMRIMESDAKFIYVHTLIDETKASIDSAVHRMQAITISMYRDALDALKKGDGALARAVYSLDDDVDHFSFFVLRLLYGVAIDPILGEQLGLQPLDCLHYQTLVHRIEQVADRATDIARHIIMLEGRKQSIPDSILELMLVAGAKVFDAYDRAVKAFFLKDTVEANSLIEMRDEIDKLDQQITSQFAVVEIKSNTVSCAICSTRDSLRETMEHAVDIAQITIDYSYEML
jgi:phosphate uptake regulator